VRAKQDVERRRTEAAQPAHYGNGESRVNPRSGGGGADASPLAERRIERATGADITASMSMECKRFFGFSSRSTTLTAAATM
jgi:hypothetical protein